MKDLIIFLRESKLLKISIILFFILKGLHSSGPFYIEKDDLLPDLYKEAYKLSEIEKKEKEIILFKRKSAQEFLELGDNSYISGKWEDALRYYDKVLEIDPSNSEVKFRIANILYRLGEDREAKKIILDALNYDVISTDLEKDLIKLKRSLINYISCQAFYKSNNEYDYYSLTSKYYLPSTLSDRFAAEYFVERGLIEYLSEKYHTVTGGLRYYYRINENLFLEPLLKIYKVKDIKEFLLYRVRLKINSRPEIRLTYGVTPCFDSPEALKGKILKSLWNLSVDFTNFLKFKGNLEIFLNSYSNGLKQTGTGILLEYPFKQIKFNLKWKTFTSNLTTSEIFSPGYYNEYILKILYFKNLGVRLAVEVAPGIYYSSFDGMVKREFFLDYYMRYSITRNFYINFLINTDGMYGDISKNILLEGIYKF